MGVEEPERGPLSPIDWSKLDNLLRNFHDRHFIVAGFREGFRLAFKGPATSTEGRNALSVRRNPGAALAKVKSEVKLKRIAGPFARKPFSPFKVSPLSLRPKASPGKFRLLHDLSFPHNEEAVNAGIADEDAKVTYATVTQAVEYLVKHRGSFMAKADLKDAYRQVPLASDQYWLVGFKLQGEYYHDLRLPMGARSSCAIFERFSSALVFILKDHYQVQHVIKMLDDFLFLGKTEQECLHGLNAFKDLCASLNLPLAEEKTVLPGREVTFLGIALDSLRQRAAIPREKACKYAGDLQRALAESAIPLGRLRELTGKLEHVTCIIPGARPFIRRLHDAKRGPQNPDRRVPLSQGVKEDLKLWAHFLVNFNVRPLFSFILNHRVSRLVLGSDACPKGFGGYWGSRCIAGKFPEPWRSVNIEALELYPILVLVGIFAEDMRDSRVTIRCDNQALVYSLNKLTSKSKQVMYFMRVLVLYILKFNIFLNATYLTSKENSFADDLSRGQVSKAWLRWHGMEEEFVPIPLSLRPEALNGVLET